MALPSVFNTRRIFDDWIDLKGQPLTGSVTFTGHITRWTKADGPTIEPVSINVPITELTASRTYLDEETQQQVTEQQTTGHMQVDLPLSTDPDIVQDDTYTVVVTLRGPDPLRSRKVEYDIFVSAGAPIRLRNLAPAGPVDEAIAYLTLPIADERYAFKGETGPGGGDGLGPEDVAAVAISGAYADLTGKPDVLTPTAASATYATPAQAAAASPVQSVAGKTGAVSLVKSDVGLGLVDNVSAASLRDRSTHTGLQPATSITDLLEFIQDAVGAMFVGGNVTATYTDNGAGTGTISLTGASGGAFDPEATRDAIGAALIGVGLVGVTINDAGDTISISTTATANSTDAQLRDRTTHTGAQAISTVTGLQAALDAKAAATALAAKADLVNGVVPDSQNPPLYVTAPLAYDPATRTLSMSGTSGTTAVTYRATNDLMPVAGHTTGYTDRKSPSNYTGAATFVSFVLAHDVLVDTTTVVLEYGGWYANGNNGEIPVGNSYTLRVGIERADGTIVPVTWRGADTVLIENGAPAVRSDPVLLDQDAGTIFYTRQTVTPTGGTNAFFPTNVVSLTAGTNGTGVSNTPKQGFSTSADLSRVTTGGAGAGSNAFGPRQILGTARGAATRKLWLLVGDSITNGSAHDAQTSGAWENACIQAKASFVKVSQGNQAAVDYTSFTRRQYRALAVPGCSDAILSLATNDFAGGRTAAQVGADLLVIAGLNRRAGVQRQWLTTVLPRTDAANTTPVSGFAVGGAREQHNTWVRAGAPVDPTTKLRVAVGTSGALLAGATGHPLAGYIETADTVESARNSGLWKANMQSDGVHPNTAAHLLMQAAILPVVSVA